MISFIKGNLVRAGKVTLDTHGKVHQPHPTRPAESRGHLNSLTKWSGLKYLANMMLFMPKTQLRNKVVDIYQSGLDDKAICKVLGPTVGAIIHKWRTLERLATLPRSDWPTKISPRAHQPIIYAVAKEPRTGGTGGFTSQLRSEFMIQ